MSFLKIVPGSNFGQDKLAGVKSAPVVIHVRPTRSFVRSAKFTVGAQYSRDALGIGLGEQRREGKETLANSLIRVVSIAHYILSNLDDKLGLCSDWIPSSPPVSVVDPQFVSLDSEKTAKYVFKGIRLQPSMKYNIKQL